MKSDYIVLRRDKDLDWSEDKIEAQVEARRKAIPKGSANNGIDLDLAIYM